MTAELPQDLLSRLRRVAGNTTEKATRNDLLEIVRDVERDRREAAAAAAARELKRASIVAGTVGAMRHALQMVLDANAEDPHIPDQALGTIRAALAGAERCAFCGVDPTAQSEPLTTGQQIVAAYEADRIAEPCELAASIDRAIAAAVARCADIARTACLVPPDGGSPTEVERELCESIAAWIMKQDAAHPARCPTCGDAVASIFDHVDGCPGEIIQQIPHPMASPPEFAVQIVGQTAFSDFAEQTLRKIAAGVDLRYDEIVRELPPALPLAGIERPKVEPLTVPTMFVDVADLPAANTTFRHVKRGTVYHVEGLARVQCPDEAPLTEADVVVVYRAADDGSRWVRRFAEFHDGRFVPLPDEDGGER